MARIDQSMKHSQTPDVAMANFRTSIEEAQTKYAKWIRKVDWSPDSRVATLSGPGYSVDLTCDDEFVHARGNVSLMIKLMERPILRHVAAMLDRQATAQAQGDGPPV